MSHPLWITYAWSDNTEGDFYFLVQELSRAGIRAEYDRITLIPGRRLWDQIAHRIASVPLSGWAYLLTPASLGSTACQEELAYALQRVLESRGEEFPLIGLLHGVSIRDIPLALRVRLCVSLASPDWVEEVRAAVTGTPVPRTVPEQGALVVKAHRPYPGQPDKVAIEVHPRFGELRYWRFAFPSAGPQPSAWGTGPANGAGISGIKREAVEGEYADIGGTPMKFIGAGDPIAPSTSAYALFDRELPEKWFFGLADSPFSADAKGEVFSNG